MAFIFKQSISFIYLFVFLTRTASSLFSHDEECLALLQFKQSTFHQDNATFSAGGFQKFVSWKKIISNRSGDNGFDCCLWDGVACSNEGFVTGLDLSNSFLHGRINSSSSLFNLVHLQMLNLSMNDFVESQIPYEIALLNKLKSLDLSYSGFSGQIPNEISHLVQLSSLDLSGNPLTLQSPSLEYLLQNLTKLEELHLSGVDIRSSIPRFLANFSSLRSVQLNYCQLQGEFPSTILHLPKLRYLSVENNPKLTGSLLEFHNTTLLEYLSVHTTGFAGIIPESIWNLNHLLFLRLSNCRFSGHIPASLSNVTQLTHLDLGQNEFIGVVPSLVSLSKLIFVSLSNNEFENGRIPYWLSNLTRLKQLNLNNMNIYDKIPSSLVNLTELHLVAMASNFIYGGIPSWFMNLTQLSYIDLQRNQLQGPLSSAFNMFKGLEYLNLGFNNFSGRVELDTFIGLNKLQTLVIENNRISFVDTNNYTDGTLPQLEYLGLSGCNLKEFPAFLRFQNKMKGLCLNNNKIEGLVPVWIWNNSQETLRVIELSYNFITGFEQHPRVLPWVHLDVFNVIRNQLKGRPPITSYTTNFYLVSFNELTGEIPSWICGAKSLQVLDLSFNNMTGTLPPCLSNLSNFLSILNLKRNNFYGTMMNTFIHGSLLRRIDLAENHFTGPLSKSLINCTNLEVLSVGDNFFEDVFPVWLGSLAKLQVLILRSNKFYGVIQDPLPNYKSHFSSLRIIDLSNNDFSGQFPKDYFQSWNAMKSVYVGKSLSLKLDTYFGVFTNSYEYSMTLTNKGVKTEYEKILNIFTAIDMSCNNFEGQIPLSLQDLEGIQSLNLSNNHFTGGVLPSLGNLKNLESLDLSRNELSGDIPQHLLQLGFLAFFNVSFNHLDGRIPQGKQFNTFENSSYKGNPELCGEPLSKECRNSKASTLPPTSIESESLLPSNTTDWIIVFLGVVSGLVTGAVFGKSRSARYSHWLIERLGMRKEYKFVRPLKNTRTIPFVMNNVC